MVNLMMGSSHLHKSAELQLLVDQFSNEVHKIFKYSAKMFIVPPKLLKMINHKTWNQFEDLIDHTLAIGAQITDHCLDRVELKDGMLLQMLEANIDREYIKGIFVDLIIAAGDTVSLNNAHYCWSPG